MDDMKFVFTPGIVISVHNLGVAPIKNLIERYDELRKECKKLFNYRWDNNVFFITDGRGAMYQLILNMDSKRRDVVSDVWSTNGKFVFGNCFKLDDTGCLPREAIAELRQAMEDYTDGYFRCWECKQLARRFSEGTGNSPTGEVCRKCWQDEKVKAKVRQAYHIMSS